MARAGRMNIVAEIVNLRQFRKQKTRKEKTRKADEKAALFGRTLSARERDELTAQKAERHLDQHRREPEE